MAGRAITRGGRITSRAIVPVIDITPPETIPPTPVTNLRVTAKTDTTIDLAWDAATDQGGSGLAGYTVALGFVDVGTPTATSYQATGLTASTEYTFRVRARDNAGNESTVVTVTETTDAAAVVGSWPIQSITKGWGVTINLSTQAGTWLDNCNTLWTAMDNAGKAAEWQFSRMQLTWDTFEPQPPVNGVHTYNFNASEAKAKIGWCVSKGIRPILMFTFAPYWATIQGQVAGCTITNTGQGGNARIYKDGINDRSNWRDIHVRGGGLATNTMVELKGQDAAGDYVECNKPAATVGTNQTVIFGGHKVGTTTYHSQEDNHMGIADGTGATTVRDAAVSILEGSINAHLPSAQALVAFIHNVRLTYPSVDPVIEYWNEANGDHGYRPGYDLERYNTTLRYLYRALKEYDPTIPLAQTGANNAKGVTPGKGLGLNGPLFLRESWRYMKSDPAGPEGANDTWAKWQVTTSPLVGTVDIGPSTYDVSNTTMNSLRSAGSISTKFWLDFAGLHTYGFSVARSATNPKPYPSWLATFVDSAAENIVTVLNDMYTEDPTSGKTGLNRMKIIQSEAGPPFHPLAQTGVGATVATLGINMPSSASSEEAYFFITILKQLIKKHRAWPTGGAIPAKLDTWDVRDRLAIINIQRLNEVSNETYAGADTFIHQGFFASVTSGSVTKGDLKRSSGTTRPSLTTGVYATSSIGTGNDAVEAFYNSW